MKAKRTKTEKREAIQRTLEAHRRFDYDYIPFGTGWEMPDEYHDYRLKGWNRLSSFLIRTLECVLGPLLIKVVYGAKVVGKENLKAIKGRGAFCVCNHFSYLDTLFLRHAVGHYRSYFTVAPQNNKKGGGGWFLRCGGALPFSANLKATRNLWSETERLLQNGKIINFYAEQAMWVNYQKPRPMKEGVFRYAVKFNAPVLPVFCTFRKDKKGRIRRLRIHILPLVEADESLPKNARAEKLQRDAERAWKNCYEQEYNTTLEYLAREMPKSQDECHENAV